MAKVPPLHHKDARLRIRRAIFYEIRTARQSVFMPGSVAKTPALTGTTGAAGTRCGPLAA
ncbi:MAG: hypothetical protein ACYC92_06175 [Candidatus Acidiferrales bacterium]